MRFVCPLLFSVMIAVIFVSFYPRLLPPLQLGTSETALPDPSRPNPLQVVRATPALAPDVTPEPKLDAVAATPALAPDEITAVTPNTVAMAAKPTAAKLRNQTEPVEEKANSWTITKPEVPPSIQPLATPDPVPKKEPTTIGQKIEDPTSDQLSKTSDPVLKKAKVAVAAKMEDSATIEFVDVKRAVNKVGQSFETICGHVKGRKNSGDAIGERPFLYLVKGDEAFIVGGNPDSMAAIVYRAHCISANEPKLDAVAAAPAPAHDVTPEPEVDAVAAAPAPAPDVAPEPKVDAVPAAPAPAPVAPEPKVDAVAATPAPAPDVTPEPKLDAAPKVQLAPDVLRKVRPAAGRAKAVATPKRVTATGPTRTARVTTGREPARPRERDFSQAAGELPPH